MRTDTFKPRFNFLGLGDEFSSLENSKVLVLPVPYEMTTSYGKGTSNGPSAIIEASGYLELYDEELGYEPGPRWGIHTLPALAPDLRSPRDSVEAIASAVAGLAVANRLLVVIGGEHAVSIGVARGLHAAFGDFLTIQFDAHCDLRASYEGTAYSHACTARRISEQGSLVQIGIRSLDIAEAQFLGENRNLITCHTAEEVINSEDFLLRLSDSVRGKRVFLTVDIDVLDPAIMPSTGTPEPGGLSWRTALRTLRVIADNAEVLAFDCVELCPIPGQRAPDFTAAKLVYKIIGYIMHRKVAAG